MGRAARWVRGLLGVGGGKKKKNTIAAGPAGDGTMQNIISRPSIGNSSNRREETKNGSENKNLIGSPVGLRKSTVRVVGNEDDDGNVMKGWRRRIECFAAVKIQSFFRGYLARKARRALRAIVKLQAVVRGYLVRKQLARTLYTMQALFNAWSQHCTRASPAIHRTSMKLKLLFDEAKSQTVYTDAVSTSFNGSITTTIDSPLVGEVNSSMSKSSNNRFSSCKSLSEDRSCNIPHPIKVRVQRSVQECEHRSSSFHVSDEGQSARLVKTPRRSDCNPLGSPNYMLCTKSFMAKIKSQNSPKQRFESRRRAFEAEMGIYAR